MTPEQFNIIKKLLRGDFPSHPTPATHDEFREIDIDGWRYEVKTLDGSQRNLIVEINIEETACISLDDVDGNWIFITRDQCDEWYDYQLEQAKFADKD